MSKLESSRGYKNRLFWQWKVHEHWLPITATRVGVGIDRYLMELFNRRGCCFALSVPNVPWKFPERVNTLGKNLGVGSLSGWPIAFFFLAASSFDIQSSKCIHQKCSFILSFRLNCLLQSGQENFLTSECLMGGKKNRVSCTWEGSTSVIH